MKKWMTAMLALTLSVTLWGCAERTQMESGGPSTPSASAPGTTADPGKPTVPIQPDVDPDPVRPLLRPMHQLGYFDRIIGWYRFTYAEDGRYPTEVVAEDLQGNVKQIYRLELDEQGVPSAMILCDANGNASGQRAQLGCDDKGNIVTVSIQAYDQIVGGYLLEYDATGRMVKTTMELSGMSMELFYDQRYCVTRIVVSEGQLWQQTDLDYDADYNCIKRICKDQAGNVLEGFEAQYDDAGVLRQQKDYYDGILVRQLTYNEKGLLAESLQQQKNGDSLLSRREVYSYDQQDRVVRIDKQENGDAAGCVVMAYEGDGCRTTVYDANNGFVEESYTEKDSNGNIIKQIHYDEAGNVLAHMQYGYDVLGNMTSEHFYDEQGLQSGYDWEFDAQGRLVRQSEYVRGEGRIVKQYRPGESEPYRVEKFDEQDQFVVGYENAYDEAGMLVKCYTWWKDAAQEEWFDEDGLVTTLRKLDLAGNELRKENYTYHANGCKASMVAWENDVRVEVKQYDDHGNVTAATYYSVDGVVQWQEKFSYTYDAEGHMESKIFYNRQEQPVKKEEYNCDGVVESTIYYDAEGGMYIQVTESQRQQDGLLEITQRIYSGNGRMLFDILCVFHTDTGHMHSITVRNGVDVVVYDQQLDLESREYLLQAFSDAAEGEFCKDYKLMLLEKTAEGNRPLLQLLDDGSCEAITVDSWGNPTTQVVYNSDGTLQKELAWAYEYYASGQIRKLTSAENGSVTHISEYDEAGILVKQTSFYGPGLWRITEYDHKGLEKIATDYNADGTVSGKWVYERYDNELIKTRRGYYGSGALMEFAEYTEEGLPKTWNRYYEDGSLMWETFYSRYGMLVRTLSYEQNGMWAETLYNELEQEYRILTYDENNNLLMHMEYIYDAYGRRIREEHYDGNGVLQDYVVYTYRGSSQMLQSAIVYKADGSVVQETYFDEHGNPIIE